jgi:hypothetical protein
VLRLRGIPDRRTASVPVLSICTGFALRRDQVQVAEQVVVSSPSPVAADGQPKVLGAEAGDRSDDPVMTLWPEQDVEPSIDF